MNTSSSDTVASSTSTSHESGSLRSSSHGNASLGSASHQPKARTCKGGRVLALVLISIAVLVVDALTKRLVSHVSEGTLIAGPYLGLFDIRFVKNTGAAWGIFSNATFMLGVFSVVLCTAAFVYFLTAHHRMNWAQTIGLALIIGGGFGNAIDRFSLSYVVDFIETTFIQFPIFNVADMGVTCGIVIFLCGLFLQPPRLHPHPDAQVGATHAHGEASHTQADVTHTHSAKEGSV